MIRKVAKCAAAIVMLTALLAAPAAGETVTLFVTSEKTDTVIVTSNTVTIIDGPRRMVLGTLNVPPRPHGLAVLVHSP